MTLRQAQGERENLGAVVPQDANAFSDDARLIAAINILRQDEGSSVTMNCDNPDFNGQPNCAITCCGDWTDWEERRFPADTLLQCFDDALTAYAPCCNTAAEDGE